MKLLVAVVVALLALGGCGDGSDEAEPDVAELRDEARVACREFVKDELKAPATATFANEEVAGSGPAFAVRGEVDAENSFGAKIRSTFTCSVEQDGERWQPINVDVFDS